MSPRQHELLSLILLGIGTAVIFLGYDVQAFFAESVIHSLHSLYPKDVSPYAGYYGQAIHYLGFAFFSLFTASIVTVISAKLALIIMSILFCIYYVGFYHVNMWFYYFTQVLLALGYALYNNADGIYIAEHSSKTTLVSNTGLVTALGHVSLLSAGIFQFIINYFFSNTVDKNSNFRNLSLEFIQIMYSGLLGLSLLGGTIFILLPTKQQADSFASKTTPEPFDIKRRLKKMYSTALHPNVLLLAVTSAYQGFFNSFFLGVYSTALTFTYSVKDDPYLIAFYSLFIGIAHVSGFIVISPLTKLVPKHRLIITILTHVLSLFLGLALINCTVPNESTIRPTRDGPLILELSRWTISATGFLLGLADYNISVARGVICQIAVPEARAEVFSLTRIFMSLAACSILFIAPHLTLQLWTIIIMTVALIGAATFTVVARKTGRVIRPELDLTEPA